MFNRQAQDELLGRLRFLMTKIELRAPGSAYWMQVERSLNTIFNLFDLKEAVECRPGSPPYLYSLDGLANFITLDMAVELESLLGATELLGPDASLIRKVSLRARNYVRACRNSVGTKRKVAPLLDGSALSHRFNFADLKAFDFRIMVSGPKDPDWTEISDSLSMIRIYRMQSRKLCRYSNELTSVDNEFLHDERVQAAFAYAKFGFEVQPPGFIAEAFMSYERLWWAAYEDARN